MYALIFRFFDICLLRAGPQDLPASTFLLRALVLLNLSLSALLVYARSDFQHAFWGTIIDFAVLVLMLQMLLRLTGFVARFNQTLTAFMGIDIIIGLISLPFSYAFLAARQAGEVALLSGVIWQLTGIWAVVVTASIIKHATKLNLAYGVVFSMAYFILIWVLDRIIFYSPPVTA